MQSKGCVGVLRALQVTYTNGVGPLNGRDTWRIPIATAYIPFADGEVITGVSGAAGNLVDSLTFTTNKATYGPFGGTGGNKFTFNGQIYGVFGLKRPGDDALQAIGFYY